MIRHTSAVVGILSCALFIGEARADLLELKWGTEGYFRTRAVTLSNLARQDRIVGVFPPNGEEYVIPEIKNTSYITSRLRITPTLSYANIATLHTQIDALDDILWGDNNGLASAPLFATDGTHQNFLGEAEQETVRLHKAWIQFQIPVGIMRVGRMPSHWGMGLLANGGGNFNLDPDPTRPKGIPQRKNIDTFFDDDFGDNHFGSVADRILFITKPITIAKTIMKKKDKSSKLVVGYAFDKLSEAPFFPAEPFERRFRPFGQQGFISRGSNDDVNEHVWLAVWNDPYPDWGGDLARHTDELRLGTYFVLRTAKEGSTFPSDPDLNTNPPPQTCGMEDGVGIACVDTGSDVFIMDFWGRFRYGPYYAETEVLGIVGDTFGGIPFPAKNEAKSASIYGGVLRLGYFLNDATNQPLVDMILELGHASGDDVLEDAKFKQRALHPDYNVGLILYEEILRELSARVYGTAFFSDENPDGARGFFSNGGVINSSYVNPKVRYHLPVGGFTLIASGLMAWVDEPALGVALFSADDLCDDPNDCGFFEGYLGTEIDLALKTSFAGDKMIFSLETGALFFGDALKSVFPNADHSLSLQSRVAFVW